MKKIILIGLFLSSGLTSVIAQSTEETAAKYLSFYTTKQFDAIKAYYTDESIFQDATMSFFDQQGKYETLKGSENISAFLKEGFASISEIDYQVQHEYAVGVISYSYGILKYEYVISHEGQQKSLKIELPLAIVLEVKNGKVIRHQDIADYNKWYEQYKAQINH